MSGWDRAFFFFRRRARARGKRKGWKTEEVDVEEEAFFKIF